MSARLAGHSATRILHDAEESSCLLRLYSDLSVVRRLAVAAKALRNGVPLTLKETHFFGNGICVSETTAAAKLISHGSILLDFSPQAKTIQRILNRGCISSRRGPG